jgi:hypothetical protein
MLPSKDAGRWPRRRRGVDITGSAAQVFAPTVTSEKIEETGQSGVRSRRDSRSIRLRNSTPERYNLKECFGAIIEGEGMTVRSPLAVALLTIGLFGCNGHVVMTPANPTDVEQAYINKSDIDGFYIYRAMPIIEVDEFTQYNQPGASGSTKLSDDCHHVASRQLKTIADGNHPYRLHYEHGLLETYTFGATMTSDGILTNINSVSTPDQGKTFQNLASAASSAAGIPREGKLPPVKSAAAPPALKPDCTTTPVFVGYERPPTEDQIKNYMTTPIPQ